MTFDGRNKKKNKLGAGQILIPARPEEGPAQGEMIASLTQAEGLHYWIA
jgi:hypothetical protein